MSNMNDQWVFLGYDLTKIGYYFRAALKELCYSSNSLLAKSLAEAVKVNGVEGDKFYLNDSVVPTCETQSEAVFLSEEHCLVKRYSLLASAEIDVENFIRLEVQANSPFSDGMTRSGWRLIARDYGKIDIVLVITSEELIKSHYNSLNLSYPFDQYETWFLSEGLVIEIEGGEARRQRYNNRLKKFFILLFCAWFLLLVIGGIPTFYKQRELSAIVEQFEEVQTEAKVAVDLREQLIERMDIAEKVKEHELGRYSVIEELERLAVIIPDDAYLSSFEMKAGSFRIVGLSSNASSLLQKLLAEPKYDSVVSPSAFRKDRNGSREHFVFDITPAM